MHVEGPWRMTWAEYGSRTQESAAPPPTQARSAGRPQTQTEMSIVSPELHYGTMAHAPVLAFQPPPIAVQCLT